MLLRCCLIHINIMILRHFLYLLYLWLCLELGLFMPCLCDLTFFFVFIFIMINYWKLCMGPGKNFRKSYKFYTFFHCERTIAIKFNLQKQNIKYTKFGLFCHLLSLFRGNKAIVLILLLRACESEQFPTVNKGLYTRFLFCQVLVTL